jgi:Uncharacterized conserved protein
MSATLIAPETETQTRWIIDPAHTNVEFSAKHLMITTVRGRISDVEGTIIADEQNPANSKVDVTLKAATLDTRIEQRDQHLRSADFLDVENFPTITFRSKRIDGSREEFKLYGDLTIRGTTREIVLDVTFEGKQKDPWGGERVGFTAKGKLDRREFGLTWNQALEAGGVVVGNEIRVTIDIEAVRES